MDHVCPERGGVARLTIRRAIYGWATQGDRGTQPPVRRTLDCDRTRGNRD